MDDEVLPTYEQSGMDHDFDEGVGGMHEERSALFGQLIGPQLPFNGADIHEQAWGWGRLGNGDVDADADGDADDNDSNRAAGGSSNGDLPDLADRAGDFEDDGLHPLNVSREASPSVGVTHHEVVGQMLHLVDGEPMSEDDPPPADVTVAEHEELKMD